MTQKQSNTILVGIVVAIVAALVSVAVWGEAMTAVGWMGTFFLTSLKMVVVPLIICSIIVGITGLGDVRRLGRVGLTTLAYYGATTGAAVLLGIILVNIIQPGAGMEVQANEANAVRSLYLLSAAQADYKAKIVVDRTEDAQGEYGPLADVLVANHGDAAAVAAAGWTEPADAAFVGQRSFKGYHFLGVLPGAAAGSAVDAGDPTAPYSAVRAQNAWAVVAWPAQPGVTGDRAFYVNQTGTPYWLEAGWAGSPSAALFRPGRGLPTGIDLGAKRASIDQKQSMGVTDIILSFVSRNIMAAFSDMDVLPIIVFCLLFGGLLTTIGERGNTPLG